MLRYRQMGGWRRWFAWHPVRTHDGKWAWLKPVERALFQGLIDERFVYRLREG